MWVLFRAADMVSAELSLFLLFARLFWPHRRNVVILFDEQDGHSAGILQCGHAKHLDLFPAQKTRVKIAQTFRVRARVPGGIRARGRCEKGVGCAGVLSRAAHAGISSYLPLRFTRYARASAARIANAPPGTPAEQPPPDVDDSLCS